VSQVPSQIYPLGKRCSIKFPWHSDWIAPHLKIDTLSAYSRKSTSHPDRLEVAMITSS